ncbi:histidine kinase/DNA gyrase B/HSP90-like ATPase [Tahibacter aquaticus]|uniref:Histidine kinase/DNA gyrase B/HSP90-like ATPase n=1 Tax=Tahibacter aquaticus TaxID=520092 RepID=A0A4R6YUI4_9GAMM|nr:response regulator [Tahibacter aquaticus]TDR41997.1 histidine kinase/DNA gyrase B/HSP90-like ATPase [Tahibacter aquaticus]
MEQGGNSSQAGPALPSILIIDDSLSALCTLEAFLCDEFTIWSAQDGAEALELAQRLRPDLILLDVVMPGLDGHEVCRRLKRSADTADIPVIFVTVRDEEANEIDGLQLGAVDFIAKPFSHAVVRQRVRTHIELKRHRDWLRDLPRALGMDLHDRHAQLMTGLLLQLDALRHALSDPPAAPALLGYVNRAAALARESMEQTRNTVRGLRAIAEGEESLAEAISRALAPVAEGTPLQVSVEQRGVPFPLPAASVHAMARVAEEAASNAARHGAASALQVSLVYSAEAIDMTVRDDGCGFDLQAFDSGRHGGLGLRGMNERVAALGGTFGIRSEPQGGTVVSARLPRPQTRSGNA